MRKEKIYQVTRILLINDVCYVKAINQKQAIEKAEGGETVQFVKNEDSPHKVPFSGDWSTGDAVGAKQYKAERTEFKEDTEW